MGGEDPARGHLALPYLGPVLWVGVSCGTERSLAGPRAPWMGSLSPSPAYAVAGVGPKPSAPA